MIALYVIMYLAGYVVAYYSYRSIIKPIDDWTWKDVGNGLFIALFSWITVITTTFIILPREVRKLFPSTKPPKWL